MAIIGDFGGTSNFSFSINGKVTLFQGDDIPDDLMGNDGDVYFKSEGLIYVKRNGTWLTNDPEDLKWIPDPRLHQNTLLYSNGENYDNTKITYNTTLGDPYEIELYREPNRDTGTTSMIVPNIGWINKSVMNNLLHKTDNEVKTGRLSLIENNIPLILKNTNQNINLNSTTEVINEISFIDNEDNNVSTIASITNSKKYINNYKFLSELRIRTYNKFYNGYDIHGNPADFAQIRLVVARKNNTTTDVAFATAPTPEANANKDEIITAEWFNVKYNNLIDEINSLKRYVDDVISQLRSDINNTVNDLIDVVNNLKNSVLGIPNYANGYTVTDNPWSVPTNGWVRLYGDHNHGGHLYINDVLVIGADSGSSKEIAGHQILCPVAKNSVIRHDGSSGVYFFPNL